MSLRAVRDGIDAYRAAAERQGRDPMRRGGVYPAGTPTGRAVDGPLFRRATQARCSSIRRMESAAWNPQHDLLLQAHLVFENSAN